MVCGANPTDAHPGLRVADEAAAARGREAHRGRSARHRSRALAARRGGVPPRAQARHERRRRERARARDPHARVSRTRPSSRSAARRTPTRIGASSSSSSAIRRRPSRRRPACRRRRCAARRGCSPRRRTRPSTTASASPSTARARRWSWRSRTSRWCTGNIGREGTGVNPLRGQNNVQGSCDMGSFPHELPGYRHVSDPAVRALFDEEWGVSVLPEPGYRIPNMFDAAVAGQFKGLYVQGEDVAQSDPDTHHVTAALSSLECMIVQDLFLNETAKFAHVFLPGSSFLEKNGTFTNAERRDLAGAQGHGAARGLRGLGSYAAALQRHGLSHELLASARDHGRDRAAHADVRGRHLREARQARQHPVALQRRARPKARRRCTSTSSCAARACSA